MDSTLNVLKLFLDELGLGAEIGKLDDRILLQKAVYLGQLHGADLGYRYGWYLRGPYCPTLAADYYQLSEALQTESIDLTDKRLHPVLREQAQKARPLLDLPDGVDLWRPEWLELLASVHFLQRISRMTPEDAR